MKKMLTFTTLVLGCFLIIAATPILCVAAPLGEVAIFTEQVGWIAQGTAAAEGEQLAGLLKEVQKVVTLTDNEIGPWAEERTDNGLSDIIVTFGSFPVSLYPFANAEPEGSVAEKFLEGGNIFLNTADYIFYIVEGKGENGDTALKNMMDIDVDMWVDGTDITPTDDGKKYTPSLGFFTAYRPFKKSQIVDPWEVEVVFGDDGADLLEPAIMHDTETDGRIGIAFQEPNNPGLPRGEVFAEMIDNYLADVLGGAAVDPNQKVTTTWAHIKSDF